MIHFLFLQSLGVPISLFFFFNDTATTEIYTLSLHDALPIYPRYPLGPPLMLSPVALPGTGALDGISDPFPLADPSGPGKSSGRGFAAAMRLSTKSPCAEPTLSTTCARFSTARPPSVNSRRGSYAPSAPHTIR